MGKKQFVHCVYFEKDNHNYIVINEKDSETNKSKLVFKKDIKRPFWITKPEFRTHKYKKEYEHISKLDVYYALEHEKYDAAFEVLNNYQPRYKQTRNNFKSPYIYGIDIEAAVLIKTAYYEKNDIHPSISFGSLDIEQSMLGGKEIILITYIHEDLRVFTSIYSPFLKKNKESNNFSYNTEEELYSIEEVKYVCETKIKHYLNLYNENNKNDKNHKVLSFEDFNIEYNISNNEIDLIKYIFNAIHECKPDLCTIWNIDYDLPTILDRIFVHIVRYYTGTEEITKSSLDRLATNEPELFLKITNMYRKKLCEIMCHPEVPKEYQYVEYKKDTSKKDHITLYWHNMFISGYTRFVDGMCLYSRKRTVQGRDVSYTLQYIAEKETNIGKLELEEGNGYHQFLQQYHFLSYTAYNQCDNIPLILMEYKNKDLMTLIGTSDNSLIEHYASQSIGLTNSFYKFVKSQNYITCAAESPMTTKFCDRIPSTGGLVFDPTLTRGTSLPIIEGYNVSYGLHKYVFDLDLTSVYPTLSEIMNISKETKLSTCLEIIGNTPYLLSKYKELENLDKEHKDYEKNKSKISSEIIENLFLGLITIKQNCVSIGEDYLGLSNYEDYIERYLEYKQTN